jgi:hypothetical protein
VLGPLHLYDLSRGTGGRGSLPLRPRCEHGACNGMLRAYIQDQRMMPSRRSKPESCLVPLMGWPLVNEIQRGRRISRRPSVEGFGRRFIPLPVLPPVLNAIMEHPGGASRFI